jgi:hypothetical protein
MKNAVHIAINPRAGAAILGFAALIGAASPALAMNQEGHDEEWIIAFPPALALLEAIPEARPLPSRTCPVSAEAIAANPYEQIQLARHRCLGGIRPKLQPPADLGD